MLHFARIGIVLLIFWIATGALAQPSAVTDSIDVRVMGPDVLVVSDSMKVGTYKFIMLNGMDGWLFRSGDDPTWADPELDESDWQQIGKLTDNTDSLITDIGWFRFTFTVDSTMVGRNYMLKLTADDTGELYLNGRLVHNVGRPSATAESRVKATILDEYPHAIQFELGKQYTIAVRTTFHNRDVVKRWLPYTWDWLPFSVDIIEYDFQRKNSVLKMLEFALLTLFATVLLMVIILHVAMYIRFRTEKGNIWIVWLSLVFFVTVVISMFSFEYDLLGFEVTSIMNALIPMMLYLTVVLLPFVMSKVLEVPMYRWWYTLFILVPLVEVMRFWLKDALIPYMSFYAIGLLILSLSTIILVYVRARRLKRDSIGIVTFSLLSPVFVVILMIIYVQLSGSRSPTLSYIFVSLVVLPMPIGLSVYQMRRFFAAHGNLEGEVKTRTLELESAMERLRANMEELTAAQEQLVQQEKLASLGQLTAGIAHEIKNPLNFVNNFSQVSLEMVDEAIEEVMKEERSKKEDGGGDLGLLLEILTDVRQNLAKIHEHGSRADGIVKSMLMHSRGGSGKREPAELNQVVKEYVNLAFHGMRASKDPISVDVVEEYDPTVGQVHIVTEDFSRVILNICNNAFDAMRGSGGGTARLTVHTRRNGDRVSIEIEDNGPGIPDDIKDKILQPFFTTKRGTQGTGLGLSITHDIVKAHGGSIDIESQPGKTKFIITLPSV